MGSICFEDFRKLIPSPPAEVAAKLNGLAVEDFARCYFFDGALPADLVDDSKTDFRWGQNPTGAPSWSVAFYSADGSPVNAKNGENLLWFRRSLSTGRLRGSTATGPFGFNHLTCISKEKQNRGISKLLCAREHELFKKWGAKEAQLDAGCSALNNGAWFKLGYDLPPSDRLDWADWWVEYQVYVLERPEEKLMGLDGDFLTWDAEFRIGVKKGLTLMPLYHPL